MLPHTEVYILLALQRIAVFESFGYQTSMKFFAQP